MKAGTQNHLKVKRLMRLLNAPMYRVVGILETLWLLCADCCDEGNIGKYTDEEIADYLGWDGPQTASELVRALSDSEWIDPDDEERLVVHDWLEHCPEYIRDRVRKRLARGSKARKQKTYESPKPDIGGQSRTDTGLAGASPTLSETVPSIPNQSQPNPTQPIQTQPNPGAAKPLLVFVDLPPVLDVPEFRSVWQLWEQHRKEKRDKLTPTATKQALSKLATWGLDRSIAAIKHSIGQGWTGIYEESRNGTQRTLNIGPGQRHNDGKPVQDGIL